MTGSFDLDLVDEFTRLVNEGGKPHIELHTLEDCKSGIHLMEKYVGFTDTYEYCAICDLKHFPKN